MHAIPPIQHTHQGEDKKKVRLELNMYLTVDAHDHQNTLEDQHGHYALVCCRFNHTQKTLHMLADELDEGAIPMHPDSMEARVHFSKMSSLSACTPSRTTKPGISLPPSPSQACQKFGLTKTHRVSVMS